MIACAESRRALTAEAVLQRLPHRGDALFVREAWVDDLPHSGGGTASWSASHPVLQGHFPGLPIVPGIFLVEAAAQIAGIVLSEQAQATAGDQIGMLSGVKKVLVHSPVLPDQSVKYQLKAKPVGPMFFQVEGTGWVGERKAISFELVISVVGRNHFAEGDGQ